MHRCARDARDPSRLVREPSPIGVLLRKRPVFKSAINDEERLRLARETGPF